MAGSPGAKGVPSEERVFSLVLALVASPQGLTKSELLSSVYGYAGRSGRDTSTMSLERQFERDKVQLRQLGIPIETIDSPLESGNNQLTRYRIPKDRLQMPEHVRFNADELTLLKLASLAWADGSLGAESRWASMKLTSLGVNLDVRHLGIAPRLSIPEPAAPALQQAIDEGRIVRFDYQLPERERALERRVAPLRLHRAEGRWHLIGYDLEREMERVFLLSRIASEVQVEQLGFDPALADGVEDALARLLELRERQRVRVRVRRGSAAEARLEPRAEVAAMPGAAGTPGEAELGGEAEPPGGADTQRKADTPGEAVHLELGTLDLHALAAEIAGYGDEAQLLAPQPVRERVIALLTQVAAQHGAEVRHG